MLSLFFVVFAFSACQQSIAETVVQNEIDTNSNEVAVIDGRLSFKTNEAFGQFIEQVQLTPIQERKAREDEMGYRSLYEAGNTLNDFEIHKKLHTTTYLSSTTMPIEIVEDPDFASVLNQDGIVQLGEMVFKVTRNHIFFTSVDELNRLADDDYLANLVNKNTTAGKARNGSNTQVYLNSMDNIGYANVERPILEGDEDNQGRDVGGGVVDPNDPSTWEYDSLPDTQEVGKTWRKTYSSEKRVTGEYWNTNWIVYSSLGVKTKSQKRRILNWYTKHDANIIGVQASNVHFKLKKVPGIKIPANIENNFDSRRERISTSHHIAKDTFSSHLGAFTFYLDWKSMVGQFLDPTNWAQSYDLESVQSRHWIENPARFEGETILFK